MTGFIIWYKLKIDNAGPGGLLPLVVSNDIFSGQYVLDADIKISMSAGAVADTFTITLCNLPDKVASNLRNKQAEGLASRKPLQIDIFLGYFDNLPMIGISKPV